MFNWTAEKEAAHRALRRDEERDRGWSREISERRAAPGVRSFWVSRAHAYEH